MAVVYLGAGTYSDAGSGGTTSPGLPTNTSADTILCLVRENDGRLAQASAPAGYTEKISVVANTGGTVSNKVRMTLYWKRASASEVGPTVESDGNHSSSIIYGFNGCLTTGDPFNVVGSNSDDSLSTSISVTGVSTSADGCMILAINGSGDDQTVSSWANSNLVSITEAADNNTTQGSDGSQAMAYGILTTAGATGATTATGSMSERQANICAALQPAASGTDVDADATGAAIAGQAATVTVTGDANVDATGAETSGDAGTVTVTGDANADVTGAESSADPGTVTVTGTANVDATGAESTADAGTVTVTGDANYTVTGAESAGEAGTVIVDIGISANPSGAESAAEAGTVTVTGDANVTATGAATAGEAGTVTVTGDANVSVTGAESAGEAEAPTVTIGAAAGAEIVRLGPWGLVAQYPTVVKSPDVDIVGAKANANSGNVTVSLPDNVRQQISSLVLPIRKSSYTKAVNSDVSVNITGAQIDGEWNDPDSANTSISVDSSVITGSAGSVELSKAFLTGAAIAGEAGTSVSQIAGPSDVSGAEISTGAGEVTAIGGGVTDAAATPLYASIEAQSGTVTATYGWSQNVTGAEISGDAAAPGIDTQVDIFVTVGSGRIVMQHNAVTWDNTTYVPVSGAEISVDTSNVRGDDGILSREWSFGARVTLHDDPVYQLSAIHEQFSGSAVFEDNTLIASASVSTEISAKGTFVGNSIYDSAQIEGSEFGSVNITGSIYSKVRIP